MNDFTKVLSLVMAASLFVGCNAFVDADEKGDYECDVYCNIMMEGCDRTFPTLERCYDACEDYPLVPQFDENDNVIQYGDRVDNDDSFECRIYHGQTALEISRTEQGETNNFHCDEAAPLGGGTCSDARRECAAFCFEAVTTCNPAPSKEALDNCEERCETEFAEFEASGDGSDTKFQCRKTALDGAKRAEEEMRDTARRGLCDAAQSETPCVALVPFVEGDVANR